MALISRLSLIGVPAHAGPTITPKSSAPSVSRHELAVAALVAALGAVTGIAALTVTRARTDPMTAADAPLIDVMAGQRVVRTRQRGLIVWTVPATVEGWVTATTDAALGPALNALYAAAIKAIEADKTLGGTTLTLREQRLETVIDRTRGHRPMMAFDLSIELWVQTAEIDLISAPN